MTGPISVLVADDSEQVRQSIRAMLDLEGDFVVVGEAGDGRQAVELTTRLKPDVVLLDVNMPVLDGIAACGTIARDQNVPVVIISVQGEAEYLRRSMQMGARDYLTKPFTSRELVDAIRAATAPEPGEPEPTAPGPTGGQLITLFSAKGGTGRSLLAANLAASLAVKTRLRVAAVDLSLEFGNLASLYGVRPTASILDLCRVPGPLERQHVEKVMVRPQPVPVHLLAAPPLPHLAAEVDGDGRADRDRSYVAEILDLLKASYDFVVVDTAVGFRETNLAALDRSDRILLTAVPEVPTLENTAKVLDILLNRLEYPRERMDLVLNLVGAGPLSVADVEQALGIDVSAALPEDRELVAWSASAGQPLVLKRARVPLSVALNELALRLLRPSGAAPAAAGLSPGGPAGDPPGVAVCAGRRPGPLAVLRSLVIPGRSAKHRPDLA